MNEIEKLYDITGLSKMWETWIDGHSYYYKSYNTIKRSNHSFHQNREDEGIRSSNHFTYHCFHLPFSLILLLFAIAIL